MQVFNIIFLDCMLFYEDLRRIIINLESKDILAINLKYYRHLAKLSQEKFAETIDTSLIYINQLEKGKRNPSLEMLDRISISISNLLGKDIPSSELIAYDKKKIIVAKRVDEIKRKSN